MAQRPKGERIQVSPRLPREVFDIVKARSVEHGMSLSQYLADVIAEHVERPDLVRELNRTSGEDELPLAI